MSNMLHTSVGVEVKVKCAACGHPVPVNALVAQVMCPSCERKCPITPEDWMRMLDEALNVIPHLEPGEQRSSNLENGATVLSARENPRCQGCKAELPAETLAAMTGKGFGLCPACGKRMSCRRAAADVAPAVPGSAVLTGEAEDQLPGPPGNLDALQAVKPVNFPCPSCNATLPVDGSSRIVTCKFCGIDSFLPDVLWQRFHPVRVSDRWYISYSLGERPFEWGNLYDLVVDSQGNLYGLGTLARSLQELHVFSLGPGLELRWVRRDTILNRGSLLSIGPDGRLFLGDPDKRQLLVLSCADGSTVGQVGGEAKPGILNFKNALRFAVDTDGTIIVLTEKFFRRFAPDGREVEPWPGVPPGQTSPELCYVGVLDPQPVNFRADYCDQIAIGWDGSIYLMSDNPVVGRVTKLDRSGKIVYQTQYLMDLQVMGVTGRAWAAASGWLSVLGMPGNRKVPQPVDAEPGLVLVVVSPDGRRQRTSLKDRAMGGPLGSEDHLAVTPEGVIWLLGHDGLARKIGPDGETLLVSRLSREQDENVRKKRRPGGKW